MRTGWAGLGLVLGACGPQLVLRPVELDIVGVQADVVRLDVLVLDPDTHPPCALIGPLDLPGFDPVLQASWRREDERARQLGLDAVELEEVRLVVAGYDELETPIQVGCLDLAFAGLEQPEVEINLSGS